MWISRRSNIYFKSFSFQSETIRFLGEQRDVIHHSINHFFTKQGIEKMDASGSIWTL